MCSRLVGHYPVTGWLLIHCSILKHLASSGPLDFPVEESVIKLMRGLLKRVCLADTVRGVWQVSPHGAVWTDASSLGFGVNLEVDSSIVEDASWLRKESDYLHITVADLEAVGHGLNMAIA